MNKFGRFLGRISTETCLKCIILVVNPQNCQALGALLPNPLASGGWGIRPQTPAQVK